MLNGQKTWSSRATYAHWGFGLFRSDPESQRHHGLTYFCFPLDADGVTVRPIAQLDGEPGFAELFFDDVFVPDADVLGEPGAGLGRGDEHGGQRARALAALPRPLLRDRRATGRPVAGPGLAAGFRDRVVDAWLGAEAYRLYTWGTVSRLVEGGQIGYAGSVNKVFWSDLDVAHARDRPRPTRA